MKVPKGGERNEAHGAAGAREQTSQEGSEFLDRQRQRAQAGLRKLAESEGTSDGA